MFPSSTYIEKVDFAFLFITAISAALLLLVTVLMIYFVFKYNHKKNKKAVNIHGSVPLEIFWTVVPIILVLGMFYFGWMGYSEASNPPANSMEVKVTGQMWKWTFDYPEGFSTDTLYVPQGVPVKLNLNSADVNHSFYIPAFRIKRDVLPNRENFLWFNAEKTGSFDVACAEYCGLRHSYMYTKVIVLTDSDYESWKKQKIEKSSAGQAI
ncbi:MAG: cytochrome c oxidase subunit II [Ignavibacteriaceae bacterium]|nr:cytochrome c oxidase subunit II [Ignavibacteriaceae bacterium]